MAETYDFPQELLIEIFSRLPTKSVGKFRCLSKSWNSNLSTKQFIKLHLTRKPYQENLILITESRSLHTITHPVQNNVLVSKKIELHNNNWTKVVDSCNGLVLLVNEEDELWLINPITTQKVHIPDSDLALNKDESRRTHGFGYDSCSDDYKIVTLSYFKDDCIDTFVDVYSVKTNVWKRVGTSTYAHWVKRSTYCDPLLDSGVFVNGAIHWLASTRESDDKDVVIAVFDLSSEVFGDIPAPYTVNYWTFSRLVVIGGHLWLVNIDFEFILSDLWTMWEYGLDETWMKFLFYSQKNEWSETFECDGIKPLCYIGEDELVLATESLFVFNVDKETARDMIVDGVRVSLNDAGLFVDSLVAVG